MSESITCYCGVRVTFEGLAPKKYKCFKCEREFPVENCLKVKEVPKENKKIRRK